MAPAHDPDAGNIKKEAAVLHSSLFLLVDGSSTCVCGWLFGKIMRHSIAKAIH